MLIVFVLGSVLVSSVFLSWLWFFLLVVVFFLVSSCMVFLLSFFVLVFLS